MILSGRSDFPERKDWKKIIDTQGSDETTLQKINRLLELESFGSKVHYAKADVSDFSQIESAFIESETKFGKIDGVIDWAPAGPPGGGG